MRRLPLPRALLATLVVLPVVGAGFVLRAGSSHAARAGMIVFASDRLKSEPGEIYSLGAGSAPRDVSRSLAWDYGLAVSPAGDQIAFWSGRTGTDQIYLARADGSGVRRVRQAGGDIVAQNSNGGPLVFSGDGTRLFTSGDAGPFVIDTRTAIARTLPICPTGVIAPSPNGRLLACGEQGETVVYGLAYKVHFRYQGEHPIWSSRGWLTNQPGQGFATPAASASVFNAAGQLAGRIQGQPVDWSPDGRSLLFRRGQSLRISAVTTLTKSRLLVAKWAGGASFTPDGRYVSTASDKGPVLVPLAGGPAIPGLDFGGGVWSRTGRLAYIDYRGQSPRQLGGKVAVYITDSRGRNPRMVGRFAYDDAPGSSELRWLPGGRRVLFSVANSCGGSGLFAVPATGGKVRSLNSDQRDLGMPVWSPDGTRIAYTEQSFNCSAAVGSSSAPMQLESVGANGAGAHAVTTAVKGAQQSVDVDPAFDPDGSRIAFLHATSSSIALQTVAAAGGASATVLPAGKGYRRSPAWSPDGSKIAFVSGGGSIWVVAATGGTPQRVATIPQVQSHPCGGGLGLAWSPDGKRFAAGGPDGIYLITLGKPSTAKLAIRAPCAEWPSFSPDGTQIAFDAQPAHALGTQTAIMVARVDGSGLRTLSTVPFRTSVHPTWQPAS
jgi:Tol biopolymer transport system component